MKVKLAYLGPVNTMRRTEYIFKDAEGNFYLTRNEKVDGRNTHLSVYSIRAAEEAHRAGRLLASERNSHYTQIFNMIGLEHEVTLPAVGV